MSNDAPTQTISAILCADWGKECAKRSVYIADVAARSVRRVSAQGWTAGGVLEEAERCSAGGPVLATFDAPIGVPESYLAALGTLSSEPQPRDFLDLVIRARSMPRFYDASLDAKDWSVDRPFFSVPAGEGGLRSYIDAAARHGVNIYRRIDRSTGAKPVFVKSGIPGSVGSAACALWQELAPRLTADRAFRVWPFEGNLQMLLQSTAVVVGEIYPRAAYATALLDEPVASRAPLVVAKTDPHVRREAIEVLRAARWVRWLRVTLENLSEAEANEDDFDACVTASALLRCTLDRSPLSSPQLECAMSEGGILGTGSVNLRLPHSTFVVAGRASLPRGTAAQTIGSRVERARREGTVSHPAHGRAEYPCPIAGCDKVFHGSRGGWDGHVGSPRLHHGWHPELLEAEERKRRFEIEFPDFFK